MTHFPRAAVGLLTLAVGASGCTCNEPARKPAPAATASASAPATAASSAPAPARVPRKTTPAPKPEHFKAKTEDGVTIHASMWTGGQPSDPMVLLVHRLGGSRDEWTPLIERLFPPRSPLNVVALDLRGHGESTSGPGAKKLAWQSFEADYFEKMDADLTAVMAHVQKAKGGPPTAWLLAGSDLGATLVVRQAALRKGDVAGVALVSPGASIRGMDIYEPFGAMLDRPNLIVTGTRDTVSLTASKALAAMSRPSKLVMLEARGHAAQFLGEERWEAWDDLADWIELGVTPTAPSSSATPPSSDAPPSVSAPASASSGP